MLSKQFYTKFPEDVFWDSEEEELRSVVRGMLR
jgi:hypothetical protein